VPSNTLGAGPLSAAALPLALFFAVTVEMAPAGALAHIAAALHTDIGSAAAGSSIYALSTAFLALPLAGFAQRFDLRNATIIAGLSFTVLGLAAAAAPGLTGYLAFRALNGAAHAAFFPLVLALAAAAAPRNTAQAVARVLLGNGLALALGVPAAEALAALDWRLPLALASLGVAAAVSFAPHPVPQEGGITEKPAERSPAGIVWLAALFALALAGHFAYYTFLAAAVEAQGLPAALVLSLYGAAVIAATAFSGPIARQNRLGRAVAVIAIESLVLAAMATVPGPATTIIAAVTAGACFGFLPTLIQTEMLEQAPQHRALVSGAAVVAFNTGIAVGAVSGATVTGFSTNAPSLLGSALLVLSAVGLATARTFARKQIVPGTQDSDEAELGTASGQYAN